MDGISLMAMMVSCTPPARDHDQLTPCKWAYIIPRHIKLGPVVMTDDNSYFYFCIFPNLSLVLFDLVTVGRPRAQAHNIKQSTTHILVFQEKKQVASHPPVSPVPFKDPVAGLGSYTASLSSHSWEGVGFGGAVE